MTRSNLAFRDARAGDAEALAHILVTANEAAFRGRIPDQCLAFTEAESAANWRRTLLEGLPPDDFLVIAELPGDGQVSLPATEAGLHKQNLAAYLRPCQPGYDTGYFITLIQFLVEYFSAQDFAYQLF